MIYYLASDDEADDITPKEDWYAFSYFIARGGKRPKHEDQGIMVSLSIGESRWSKIGWENIQLVPEPIPSDVMHEFARAIFEAKK